MVLFMKKIIAIISFNIILFLVVICIVNFTGNDIKVSYLKDVSGYDLSSALDYLYDYEINVLYVESDEKESVILYTKPKADSLVYENKSITLYVSKGFKSEK